MEAFLISVAATGAKNVTLPLAAIFIYQALCVRVLVSAVSLVCVAVRFVFDSFVVLFVSFSLTLFFSLFYVCLNLLVFVCVSPRNSVSCALHLKGLLLLLQLKPPDQVPRVSCTLTDGQRAPQKREGRRAAELVDFLRAAFGAQDAHRRAACKNIHTRTHNHTPHTAHHTHRRAHTTRAH